MRKDKLKTEPSGSEMKDGVVALGGFGQGLDEIYIILDVNDFVNLYYRATSNN